MVQEFVAILRTDSNIDFSHYRGGTLSRRISRRISITGMRGVDDYVRRLSNDAAERASLRSDLLIGVTGFFRDPEAWQSVRKFVIEPLLQQTDNRAIRCWVSACSTSEEVYSLAMLLRECQEAAGTNRDVKIFATDIDKRALESAATGVYSFSIRDELSQERLSKFFVQEGTSFRIHRNIRESIIFAEHSLTRDAPLTNIDIVTCRNALIYMEPTLQWRVLSMLHFALRVEGTLFLGSAESCGEIEAEFRPLDNRWKLYSKRRDVVLRQEGKRPALSLMRPVMPKRRPMDTQTSAPTAPAQRHTLMEQAFRGMLHDREAATFLIGEHNQLLHSFGKAHLYTRIREGAGTSDFSNMLLQPLQLAFGTAKEKARSEKKPARSTDISTEPGGPDGRKVNLTVIAVETDASFDSYLVTIEDSGVAPKGPAQPFTVDEHVASRISSLEEDLKQSRESLQATIEELETANEEHQATNEELMASNEELQSTNEELQSVNEELYTVNAEHQNKIQELTDLNDDVENLLRNTPISTLFLDNQLHIRKFTPGIRDIVNITESDVGRSVLDFQHRIEDCDLWKMLESALADGERVHSVVRTAGGDQLILRVVPYSSEQMSTKGLILTTLQTSTLSDLVHDLKDPDDKQSKPPQTAPAKPKERQSGDEGAATGQ